MAVNPLQAQLDAKVAENKLLQTDKTSIQSQLDIKIAENTQLQTDKTTIQSQLDSKIAESSQLQTDKTSIQSQLDIKIAENSQLQTDLQDKMNRIQELQDLDRQRMEQQILEQKKIQDLEIQLEKVKQIAKDNIICQNLDKQSGIFEKEVQGLEITGKSFKEFIFKGEKQIKNYDYSKQSQQIAISGLNNSGKQWCAQNIINKKIVIEDKDTIINVIQDQHIQVILNKQGTGKNCQLEEQSDNIQKQDQQMPIKQILEQQNFDNFIQESIIQNKELDLCLHVVSDLSLESQKSIIQIIDKCPKDTPIYIILNLKNCTRDEQILDFINKNLTENQKGKIKKNYLFQDFYNKKPVKYLICANNQSEQGKKQNELAFGLLNSYIEQHMGEKQKTQDLLTYFTGYFNENIDQYLCHDIQEDLPQQQNQTLKEQKDSKNEQKDPEINQEKTQIEIKDVETPEVEEEENFEDQQQTQCISSEYHHIDNSEQQKDNSENQSDCNSQEEDRYNEYKEIDIKQQNEKVYQFPIRMEYNKQERILQMKFQDQKWGNQIEIVQKNLYNYQFGNEFVNNPPKYIIYQNNKYFVIYLSNVGIQNITDYYISWESVEDSHTRILILTGKYFNLKFQDQLTKILDGEEEQGRLEKIKDEANILQKGFFKIKIPICSFNQFIGEVNIDRDDRIARDMGMVKILIEKK